MASSASGWRATSGGSGAPSSARHRLDHGVRQRLEVVAALEHGARPARPPRSPSARMRLAIPPYDFVSSAQPAERVVAMGVVAGRDQDQVGPVLAPDGHHDVLDQRQERRLAGARRHRHVDRVALAVALAHVVERARAGPERPLVDAHEQHLARVVEERVRAVAVVHVPVHAPSRARRRARRARAGRRPPRSRTGRSPSRVARSAWWPGGRSDEKPVRSPPVSSASASAHAPPAALQRRLVGARARRACRGRTPALALRVLAHAPATYSAGCTRSSCSSVAAGASRRSQPSQSRLLQLALDRADAVGPLRVAEPGVVLERRVVAEERRHARRYRTARALGRLHHAPTSPSSAPAPPASTPPSWRPPRARASRS